MVNHTTATAVDDYRANSADGDPDTPPDVEAEGSVVAVDDVSVEEWNTGTEEDPEPQLSVKGWHGQDPEDDDQTLADVLLGVSLPPAAALVNRPDGGSLPPFWMRYGVLPLPDDSTIEFRDVPATETDPAKKVFQLYHWTTGASVLPTSLADELQKDDDADAFDGEVLVRTPGGGGGNSTKLKYLPVGHGISGKIELKGNAAGSAPVKSGKFDFLSGNDSNVVVSIEDGTAASPNPKIKIDVYYV